MSQSIAPVEHLSWSAINTFLSNPLQFKKEYIDHLWSTEKNSSTVIGIAAHEGLRVHHDPSHSVTHNYCLEVALRVVDEFKDGDIKYNTSRSPRNRSELYEEVAKVLEWYWQEEPNYGEILATEVSHLAPVFLNNKLAPLPLKGKLDMISRINGKIWLNDYKFTARPTIPGEIDIKKFMQAASYYHIAKDLPYGEPEGINYIQVKTSKSRTGGQVTVYPVEFKNIKTYLEAFNRLYWGVVANISSPDYIYLPNYNDMFNGEESFNDFLEVELDVRAPKQIRSATPLEINVDETKFIQSKLVKEANKNFSPAEKIVIKLKEFGITLKYIDSIQGPTVTMYRFEPQRALKLARINQHLEEIAQALESGPVRAKTPIYGTSYIGIEVPNENRVVVPFTNEVVEGLGVNTLDIALGVDVQSEQVRINLADAPHLLVAGATGTGKTVFLRSVLEQLSRNSAAEIHIIDPKGVELVDYESVARSHVTGEVEALEMLDAFVQIMEDRYDRFKGKGVTSMEDYNNKKYTRKLERIVVIVDELADLLLTQEKVSKEVTKRRVVVKDGKVSTISETKEVQLKVKDLILRNITKLTQKARAAGIHLILATQRPDTKVIPGTLKANLPTRVAFRVATSIDSQVILDQGGAEKLVGKGDMLVMKPGGGELVRAQGYLLGN